MIQIRRHPFKKCFKFLETKIAVGSIIYSAAFENGVINVYSRENTDIEEMETRKFIIINSGEIYKEDTLIYINSVTTFEEVVHVFEQIT